MQDLKSIKIGNTVKLHSDNLEGQWTGKVKRISDQIDPSTQSVIVFISVSGKNLREGMYLRGDITAGNISNAIEIPRNLLVDQKAVYTIQGDSLLVLQNIDLIRINGTKAIIQGVEDNAFLLKEILPGMYDGMKVEVRK